MTATILRARRIAARLVEHRWAWAQDNRDTVAAHWARRLAERPAMFDGEVLLARDHRVVGETVEVALFAAPFSAMLTHRDLGAPDRSIGNAFAAAAPRSSDGAFLLGLMNGHTANAGQLYFPCGTPDPSDVRPDGTVDLEGSALRELAEETGLVADDLVLGEEWTLVIQDGFLAFIRPVAVAMSTDAARSRIGLHLSREAQPELADIVPIRVASEIDPARMPSYACTYLKDAFAQG